MVVERERGIKGGKEGGKEGGRKREMEGLLHCLSFLIRAHSWSGSRLSLYLLLALFTEVSVVSLEPVTLDELILHGFLQCLGLHWQREGEKGLLTIVGVVAASADLLVKKHPSKYLLKNLRII